MSSPRFTMVARSASLNTSRSPIETSSSATKASSVSATETRTPDFRRRFVKSISFCCIAAPLLQQALLGGRRRGCGRCAGYGRFLRLPRDEPAELRLRLLDVALVLQDHVQRVLHERFVEGGRVQREQRA